MGEVVLSLHPAEAAVSKLSDDALGRHRERRAARKPTAGRGQRPPSPHARNDPTADARRHVGGRRVGDSLLSAPPVRARLIRAQGHPAEDLLDDPGRSNPDLSGTGQPAPSRGGPRRAIARFCFARWLLRKASGGPSVGDVGGGLRRWMGARERRPGSWAVTRAVWWRWSLRRLGVAVMSRHSERQADLPRRWKRSIRRLNFVLAN